MEVSVRKSNAQAILPTYATDGSGCFDLYNAGGTADIRMTDAVYFDTGLEFEIPKGYVMLLFSRSGHGFNHGVRLGNCVGVIDSDYRGSVKVALYKDQDIKQHYFLRIRHGDRIAQGLVVPQPRVEFREVVQLSETERGSGGFGSTGL